MRIPDPFPRIWPASGTCSSSPSRTSAWNLMNSTNLKPTTGNLWLLHRFRCRHNLSVDLSVWDVVLFWNASLTCMFSGVIALHIIRGEALLFCLSMWLCLCHVTLPAWRHHLCLCFVLLTVSCFWEASLPAMHRWGLSDSNDHFYLTLWPPSHKRLPLWTITSFRLACSQTLHRSNPYPSRLQLCCTWPCFAVHFH